MSSNNNTGTQGIKKIEVKDSVDGITYMRPQKPASKPEQKPKK